MLLAENRPSTTYCQFELTEKAVASLTHAVDERYWYQMYIDDLPAWALIGESEVSTTDDGTHGM